MSMLELRSCQEQATMTLGRQLLKTTLVCGVYKVLCRIPWTPVSAVNVNSYWGTIIGTTTVWDKACVLARWSLASYVYEISCRSLSGIFGAQGARTIRWKSWQNIKWDKQNRREKLVYYLTSDDNLLWNKILQCYQVHKDEFALCFELCFCM